MKRRVIAIGSAIALTLGILTFTHAANAAEAGCKIDGGGKVVNPCPKDAAMKLCKRSKVINGEQQFIELACG